MYRNGQEKSISLPNCSKCALAKQTQIVWFEILQLYQCSWKFTFEAFADSRTKEINFNEHTLRENAKSYSLLSPLRRCQKTSSSTQHYERVNFGWACPHAQEYAQNVKILLHCSRCRLHCPCWNSLLTTRLPELCQFLGRNCGI